MASLDDIAKIHIRDYQKITRELQKDFVKNNNIYTGPNNSDLDRAISLAQIKIAQAIANPELNKIWEYKEKPSAPALNLNVNALAAEVAKENTVSTSKFGLFSGNNKESATPEPQKTPESTPKKKS